MVALTVKQVGNSLGVVLPKDLLSRMNVTKGDTLYVTEAPGGEYRVTVNDPDFERQMALAEEIMHEDRDILKVLAK